MSHPTGEGRRPAAAIRPIAIGRFNRGRLSPPRGRARSIAFGETPGEALAEVEKAKAAWLVVAEEEGKLAPAGYDHRP